MFFAPLELTRREGRHQSTHRGRLRPGRQFPWCSSIAIWCRIRTRSQYDLVGIDNRRAGYAITAHLLKAGCRRIVFIGRPRSAPTVDARISGYREAVADARRDSHICRVDPEDVTEVKRILKTIRPDGFVCANDFTAAQLLKTLNGLDVAVPGDVRMAGIDDVKYASLLPVPLTTIHQPCAELGAAADQHHARSPASADDAAAGCLAELHARRARLVRRRRSSGGSPVTGDPCAGQDSSPAMPPARVLLVGEVLWDLFPGGAQLGGAPLNVGAHLARLGHAARLVSAVGATRSAKKRGAAIASLGIDTTLLQSTTRFPTGTATVTVSPEGETSFSIGRPAAYDAVAIAGDTSCEADRMGRRLDATTGRCFRPAPRRARS